MSRIYLVTLGRHLGDIKGFFFVSMPMANAINQPIKVDDRNTLLCSPKALG